MSYKSCTKLQYVVSKTKPKRNCKPDSPEFRSVTYSADDGGLVYLSHVTFHRRSENYRYHVIMLHKSHPTCNKIKQEIYQIKHFMKTRYRKTCIFV